MSGVKRRITSNGLKKAFLLLDHISRSSSRMIKKCHGREYVAGFSTAEYHSYSGTGEARTIEISKMIASSCGKEFFNQLDS